MDFNIQFSFGRGIGLPWVDDRMEHNPQPSFAFGWLFIDHNLSMRSGKVDGNTHL